MQKIKPFLWYDGNAEEAANYYVSIFKNSTIDGYMRNGSEAPNEEGSVLGVNFTLEGQEFIALNGGPHFTFTPAISLFVTCESQQEVDEIWGKMSEGGKELQCGWITDKFGLTWQIIPSRLGELLGDSDRNKAGNAMKAMMGMVKIDVAELERAFAEG